MILRFEKLHPDAQPPSYAHEGDAGADLYVCETCVVQSGETMLLRTGLALELMPGYEAQVRPRSGMSRRGLIVHFGTIDAAYRGEVLVTLTNTSGRPHSVLAGDRVAQLVVAPVQRIAWRQASGPLVGFGTRGTGGHGSTGR